jgi:VWFA-related protein
MRLTQKGLWPIALLIGAVALSAQTPAPRPGVQIAVQDKPTFSVQVDLVTTDVIAKDARGNFVPDLTKNDFEIFEDGIQQEIVSMTLIHGGRVTNVLAPPPPAPPEGIVLPSARRPDDLTAGRILVFFVDDLHMQFSNTLRIREIFRQASKLLLHEGDLFAIVSSGSSSISVQLTYDARRLDEAINKIMGSELKPDEIINGAGQNGLAELRWRAHVAMSTVNDLLDNLEKVHNRRKALIYVSDGYDFAPFKDARLGLMDPDSPFLQNRMLQVRNAADYAAALTGGESNPSKTGSTDSGTNEEFADAELAMELARMTRIANRANTTIYTIDPRGLIGGPDIDQPVEITQWHDYIQKSQNTLRTLAEETGGIAVVDQNNFEKALKRIDAETSDYYVLGYYSTNPDPRRRIRQLSVRVARSGVDVMSRKEYLVNVPPPAPSSKK